MKIVKTASGKKKLKISRREWTNIGRTAGWQESPSISPDQVISYEWVDYNEKRHKEVMNNEEFLSHQKSLNETASWAAKHLSQYFNSPDKKKAIWFDINAELEAMNEATNGEEFSYTQKPFSDEEGWMDL